MGGQKRDNRTNFIDTQAEIRSAAPVLMPYESTNDHSMQDRLHQGFNTNNQRVVEWVTRQIRALRPTMTTQMGDDHVPWVAVTNHARHQLTTHQTLQMDEAVGNGTWRATSRATPPIQTPVIHRPDSEQSVARTPPPRAPQMRTIPLPSVEEDSEEVSWASAGITVHSSRGPVSWHSNGGPQSWECPGAPLMRTISLPPVGIDAAYTRTNNRARQMIHLRSDDGEQWHLNSELGYHDLSRPVAKPVLSDMSPYPGHRWGARDQDEDCAGEVNIHFPYSFVPATNPPLTRMKLARPFGGKLVVTPTIGNQFVSVGDVQNTVVAWMRWEQPHLDLRLTGRGTAWARDGTRVGVEVWIWRGLTRARSEANLWEIHL